MRYRQVTPSGSTIYYIDKLMEIEWSGAAVDFRHYLGGTAILTKTGSLNDSNPGIQYVFRDRLGGVAALGDVTGFVTEIRGYDAFGKPRNADWSDKTPAAIGSAVTDRGFTDHEHLDDWQLIHMNGRGYDYNLGRFLSIDPVIQAPGNSQSINPYSYIMNNPLSGTDPSGYEKCGEVAEGGSCNVGAIPTSEIETVGVMGDGSLIVNTTDGKSFEWSGDNGKSRSQPGLDQGGAIGTVDIEETNSKGNVATSAEQGDISQTGTSWSAWSILGISSANAADREGLFERLWDSYPSSDPYIDSDTGRPPPGYENQCAIRLSVAFHGAGVDLQSFEGDGVIRLGGNKTAIRAEEFADWLNSNSIRGIGPSEVITGGDWADQIKGRTGVIFFGDYWVRSNGQRSGDHIDLWNGSRMTSRTSWIRVHTGLHWDGLWSDYSKSIPIIFWPVE